MKRIDTTIKTAAERDALVAELQAWTPARETVEEEARRLGRELASNTGARLCFAVSPASPLLGYDHILRRAIRHRRATAWETDTSKAERGESYFAVNKGYMPDSMHSPVERVTGSWLLGERPQGVAFVRAEDLLACLPDGWAGPRCGEGDE